jgi:N-acetylglucosaminyl-diphospho-decaprenol L-rhamnosyltransferase
MTETSSDDVSAVPDVSVIIISYNTRALLQACLEAVAASTGVALEVFVVDNASRDGSADLVAERFPAVTLMRNPENRGFAAANNLAIRRARGRDVLLLNPDTLVRPDTIAHLAACLAAQPDVGITGPRVLNDDGSLQSCGYWYPTLLDEIRVSRRVETVARRMLGEPRPFPDPDHATDVDWVDGCCLLIRRTVIDRIGLLDEQYFLYAEELDWCRSAKAAGWRIQTCPDAAMTHLRGRSSDQVRGVALALLIETRLRYYRKHEGLVMALLVSFVYAMGCALGWAAEPEKNRAKLRGIRQWWRAMPVSGDA